MTRRHREQYAARFAVLVVALLAAAPVGISTAQGNGPGLVEVAELDIGLDCPVTAALDPSGATLWVLMDNCFQRGYSLRAFHASDGTPVSVGDYADALASLDGIYIDLFITPMGFTPAGDLSIRASDPETHESIHLLIPLASGGEAVMQRSATYDALLATYSAYPEFSVYSPDHTRAVTAGETSFHVIDVGTETAIAEIPVEGGTDYALASFSADSARLYVTRFNNPDDLSDISSTLLIYSLPGGALLRQAQAPSSALWVSPDEAYAAVQMFSNNIGERSDLAVLDLASGLVSSASSLLDPPAPVTTCLNTGADVSDLGYMTSGYLSLASVHWLPDSSGLVLSLSYRGEGAGSATRTCIFNHSRLRLYRIEDAG